MTFHQFEEESMMVNFVERFRQIYGAKVSHAPTSDMAVNNIADCPGSKTTSNAFLKTKLVICAGKEIIKPF